MAQTISGHQNLDLAAALATLSDDTLIDVPSIAALLCLTPASARQAAYRSAETFPPRFPLPSRRLRWRLGDVREWIRRGAQPIPPKPPSGTPQIERETPSTNTTPSPTLSRKGKPGRKTKAESVRLQRKGERLARETRGANPEPRFSNPAEDTA